MNTRRKYINSGAERTCIHCTRYSLFPTMFFEEYCHKNGGEQSLGTKLTEEQALKGCDSISSYFDGKKIDPEVYRRIRGDSFLRLKFPPEEVVKGYAEGIDLRPIVDVTTGRRAIDRNSE